MNMDFLNFGKDNPKDTNYARTAAGVVGAGAGGAASTSALLYGGGLITRRRAPALSKLLNQAAWDGVAVFNPRTAYKLLHRIPEASRLTGMQLKSMKDLTDNLPDTGADFTKTAPNLFASVRKTGDADYYRNFLRDMQDYKLKYKEDPTETMGEAVGAISGVASAGAGIGLAGVMAGSDSIAEQFKNRNK